MAKIITFSQNDLPDAPSISVNGSDLVVKFNGKNFPHITFHADAATENLGDCTISFMEIAQYHVAVRSGVYFGRKYVEGVWVDNPDDTVGNFQSDKDAGAAKAAIIEQIMTVR